MRSTGRSSGVITWVNDQGQVNIISPISFHFLPLLLATHSSFFFLQCGACWAFSAVEAIESAFLQRSPSFRPLVADGWGLSVQEVVSCTNSLLVGGCNGIFFPPFFLSRLSRSLFLGCGSLYCEKRHGRSRDKAALCRLMHSIAYSDLLFLVVAWFVDQGAGPTSLTSS